MKSLSWNNSCISFNWYVRAYLTSQGDTIDVFVHDEYGYQHAARQMQCQYSHNALIRFDMLFLMPFRARVSGFLMFVVIQSSKPVCFVNMNKLLLFFIKSLMNGRYLISELWSNCTADG